MLYETLSGSHCIPNSTGSDKTCSHRRDKPVHTGAKTRRIAWKISRPLPHVNITSSEGVGPGEKDSPSILFISLVKVRECLWNNTCSDYCKTDGSSAAWREFALELKDSGDCIVYFK